MRETQVQLPQNQKTPRNFWGLAILLNLETAPPLAFFTGFFLDGGFFLFCDWLNAIATLEIQWKITVPLLDLLNTGRTDCPVVAT